MLYEYLIQPFIEFGFMRRALVATLALAMGGSAIGVFLILRRMSLMGDALSHAILPGAAIGFLIAGGFSLPIMGLGGLVAGLAVALGAGFVSRMTKVKEDASFATFYLTSLAAGVLIVSARGSNVDLLHVLFGSILAIDTPALLLVAGIASVTLVVLALIYRPLVIECFDPGFLRAVGGGGPVFHVAFLALVVLNLVAGFEALGTLMAVGLMMLPATVAHLWTNRLGVMMAIASGTAMVSGFAGLVISFHLETASGPTIILVASSLYLLSLLLGPAGLLHRLIPKKAHLQG